MSESLAMATVTTLVASLYSKYETTIHPSFVGISPAIVSLFETLWDERYEEYKVSTERVHAEHANDSCV